MSKDRRANDIPTFVVASGRRSSDSARTYGLINNSSPSKNRGCFGTTLLVIGWMVVIFGLTIMCSLCYWLAWLFD
jgi:hypothetical protein